jgi:hypothetical protein
MSGAGFTPSNFYAETSDSKLSGRIVPIITNPSDSLLEQSLSQNLLSSDGSSVNSRTGLSYLVLSFLNRIFGEDTKSFVILPFIATL